MSLGKAALTGVAGKAVGPVGFGLLGEFLGLPSAKMPS